MLPVVSICDKYAFCRTIYRNMTIKGRVGQSQTSTVRFSVSLQNVRLLLDTLGNVHPHIFFLRHSLSDIDITIRKRVPIFGDHSIQNHVSGN